MATVSVPKPKNQGGHGSATESGGKIQKKQPASLSPGASPIEYGIHSAGHGGSGKTVNSVKKG